MSKKGLRFSQIAEGVTYVNTDGEQQKVLSISKGSNEVTYVQDTNKHTMPSQKFAKQAVRVYRDRSHDKPKQERPNAA